MELFFMKTIGHFIYFINSLKDVLSFKNNDDFSIQIKKNFNFRLKVQKFVYIAKYFGWNHDYEYNLYIRGPYSSALADEYYNMDIYNNYSPVKIDDFNLDSFKNFVKDKSIHYLESASTILFYLNDNSNLSCEKAIEELHKIKPYIDSEIVSNAYNDIIQLELFGNNSFYQINVIDDDLDYFKNTLIDKIHKYIGYFTDFGQCNNSIIVSGSLDYLHIVLFREDLNPQIKYDLLNLIFQYVIDVKEIYELCGDNSKVFEYLNLNDLEENFDRIQDYVSQELNILPRLDDDEFDEIIYNVI